MLADRHTALHIYLNPSIMESKNLKPLWEKQQILSSLTQVTTHCFCVTGRRKTHLPGEGKIGNPPIPRTKAEILLEKKKKQKSSGLEEEQGIQGPRVLPEKKAVVNY